MRLTPKYQIYLKSRLIIDSFPKRILRFKRSKWKFFRFFKNLKKRKRYKFINYFSPTVSKNRNRLIKMKWYFNNCRLSKIKMLQLYDFSYNFKKANKDLKFLKKLKYKDLFKYLIFKQLYRLDVILWKLNIYSSTFEARQAIQNRYVLVNNKTFSNTYLIKMGDIVKLSEKKYSFKLRQILNTFKLYPKYYSFLEFDPYIGVFVVIKNFHDCILDDITLTLPNKIHFNYIFNFFRRK